MTKGKSSSSLNFYQTIDVLSDFERLASSDVYTPLPEDWVVGAADIVGSTQAIHQGRYKVVNTVGAAVISAQINTLKGFEFPFAFGGDGAVFALPPQYRVEASDALSAVMRWAQEEFGMTLRAAIIPVKDIRTAGRNLTVARYRPSPGLDYAMFAGGGFAWADNQMKAGKFAVEKAPIGTVPDLTGLSCRWTPMSSKNGKILSVLVLPLAGAASGQIEEVYRAVIELEESLERGGHPAPQAGPGYGWPPIGLDIETRASYGKGSFIVRKIRLLAETLFALFLFKTGVRAGNFDPGHYTKTAVQNADFRKFDDGLKMTIDCDVATRTRLEKLLRDAAEEKIITYGISEQDQALMTCIVPSVTRDDHIHFIDGAAGGYASAASQIKAQV